MFTVTISERGKPPVKLDFDKPEITVGRVRGNDIVLQKNNVSKRHAKLLVKDSQFIIIDQKSTNGTIVNARKITAPQVVRQDDKICIGDFILTLKYRTAGPDQHAPPPQQSAPLPGPPPVRPPAPPTGPPPPPPASRVQREASAPKSSPPPPPMATDAPAPPAGPAPPSGPLPLPPAPLQQGPAEPDLGPPPGAPAPSPVTDPEPYTDPPPGDDDQTAEPAPQPEPEPTPTSDPEPEPEQDLPEQDLVVATMAASPVSAATHDDVTPVPGMSKAPSIAEPTSLPDNQPAIPMTQELRGMAVPSTTLSGFGPPTIDDSQPAITGPPATNHSHFGSNPSPTTAPSEEIYLQAPIVERLKLSNSTEAPTERSEAFEQAQAAATPRLAERFDFEELPRAYPPTEADLADHERNVDRMLEALDAEGHFDYIDRQELMTLLTHEVVALGPIEAYLDDPKISRIFVNGFDRIYVEREGENLPGGRIFSSLQTFELTVARLLNVATRLDKHLFHVELSGGTKIELVLPPAAAFGPIISIKKADTNLQSMEELVGDGALSQDVATFLTMATNARQTLLIVGPHGSGKTALLHAIGAELPEGTRIVTVDQSGALSLPQKSAVSLVAGDMRSEQSELLSIAARLAPELLLIDPITPGNASAWILEAAYSTGGTAATLAAHGERDAMDKLESMIQTNSPTMTARSVRDQLARSIQFIVVLGAPQGQSYQITKVVEPKGSELDTVPWHDVFCFVNDGDDTQGGLKSTGHVPEFCKDLQRSGDEPDLSIFQS